MTREKTMTRTMKATRQHLGWAGLISVAAITACGVGAGTDHEENQVDNGRARDEALAPATVTRGDLASKSAASIAVYDGAAAAPDASLAAIPGRKVIRQVSIDLEVGDVEEARGAMARIAAASGGFISDLGIQGTDSDRRSGHLTLRVPSDRMDDALSALSGLGKVRSETQGSQDITTQYLDTETRLRVLRETDARLREILRNRTGDLSDVLQVERELARVVTQIEQLEGQKRFWDEQVDLATIHVSMSEPVAGIEAGWADPVGAAFRASLAVLARSVALLITLAAGALPFAILGALGWLAWRGARKVRATV